MKEAIEVLEAVSRYDRMTDAIVIEGDDMQYLLDKLSSKEFRLYFIYVFAGTRNVRANLEYIQGITGWTPKEVALHTIGLIDAGLALLPKEIVEKAHAKIDESNGEEDS